MITRRQMLGFWPDVLGIAALVLPFSYGVSPLRALSIGDLSIALLGGAFCLAVPIAIWQGLRVLRTMATRIEQVLAYVLSVGATLWPVVWSTFLLVNRLWRDVSPENDLALFLTLVVSVWTLAFVNVFLLRYNLRAAVPLEVAAGVYLIGGYLPNAAFCIIAFAADGGWNVGAYVVLAACIGYVLRIIGLMRDATKSYRARRNPDLSTSALTK